MADDIILGSLKVNDLTSEAIAKVEDSLAKLGKKAERAFSEKALKRGGKFIDVLEMLRVKIGETTTSLQNTPGKLQDITEAARELRQAYNEVEVAFRTGTLSAPIGLVARFKSEIEDLEALTKKFGGGKVSFLGTGAKATSPILDDSGYAESMRSMEAQLAKQALKDLEARDAAEKKLHDEKIARRKEIAALDHKGILIRKLEEKLIREDKKRFFDLANKEHNRELAFQSILNQNIKIGNKLREEAAKKAKENEKPRITSADMEALQEYHNIEITQIKRNTEARQFWADRRKKSDEEALKALEERRKADEAAVQAALQGMDARDKKREKLRKKDVKHNLTAIKKEAEAGQRIVKQKLERSRLLFGEISKANEQRRDEEARITREILEEREKLERERVSTEIRAAKRRTRARQLRRQRRRRDQEIQIKALREIEKKEKESLARRTITIGNFYTFFTNQVRNLNKLLFTARIIIIKPLINGLRLLGRNFLEVGKFAAKASIKFEAFELQLRALNKSAINTAQEFEKIKTFAAESPLSTDEVVESFIKLKAVGVKQAFETTKTLGQIGLVFNRDLRDVTSSFISLEARTLRRLGIVINRSTSKAILESGNLVRVVDNNVNSIRDAILDIFEKKAPQAFKIFTSSVQAQLKVLLSFMEIFGADLGDKLFRKPLARALVAINAFIRNNSETLVGAFDQLFNNTNKFEANLKRISRKLGKLFSSSKIKEDLANILSGILSSATNITLSIVKGLTIAVGRSITNGFDLARTDLERRGGLLKVLTFRGEDPFQLSSLGSDRKRKLIENFKKLKKIREDAQKSSRFMIEEGDQLVGFQVPDRALGQFRQLRSKEAKEAFKRLKGDAKRPFEETQRVIAEFNKLTEGLNRSAVLATFDQQEIIGRAVSEATQTFTDGFSEVAKEGIDAAKLIRKAFGLTMDAIPEGTSEAAKKMFTASAFEKAADAIKLIESLKVDARNKNLKLSSLIIQDEAKIINAAIRALEGVIKSDKFKGVEKALELQKELSALEKAASRLPRRRRFMTEEQKAQLAEADTLKLKLQIQRKALLEQMPKNIEAMGFKERQALLAEFNKTKALLEKLTTGELSEATKEDTPQDRAKKILKEIGDAFFVGRSLGSQILDEAFLTDNKFKNKIEQFFISAAEQFDVGKTATTQKGLRELFDLMLREDKEAAEEVFKRLSASAFEDVASSGVLSRLQKSSGFLTKILRDRLKEIGDAAGSAKGRLLEMLSTTAGQNKLARDLLNSTELLKQTNEELAKAGGFFDSLGKKTSLALRQGGLEEQYVKFAKRMATVKKEVMREVTFSMQGITKTGMMGTGIFEDVVDEKKFRDLLTNVKENIVPFVDSVEGQAAKIIQIDKLLEGTDFVPSVKKKLRAQLEKTDTETLFTDAAAEIEAFKQGPLRSLEAQVGEGTALGFERFFTKLKTDAVNMAQATQTALNGIANSIQTNLVNALVALAEGTATVEDAFKQMAAAIVKDLIRLAIQYLITAAAAAVLNAFTGGAPGGVGAAASAISGGASPDGLSATRPLFEGLQFAKGGVMKGKMGPVHKYAEGGIARSPQVAIFGEGGGAEAFVPLPDGRTIPVTMRGGRGGSQNVNVNFNVSAIDQAGVASFLMTHQRDITMTVIDAVNSNRSFRSAL